MKIKFILILLFLNFSLIYSQTDTSNIAEELSLASGFELTAPLDGISFFSYYKGIIGGITYILPKSPSKDETIRVKNGLTLKIGLAPIFLQNELFTSPIYIGFGYTVINEDNVLDFTGTGVINGYHYIVGMRMIPNKSTFWKRFGSHLELGYTSWNYDNSILKTNNSTDEYKYPEFFFSMGLYYFIL